MATTLEDNAIWEDGEVCAFFLQIFQTFLSTTNNKET
jgi:hypothetical protein